MVDSEYDIDFVKRCRKEFMMNPSDIKKIVTTLTRNGYLDVERLIKDVERVKYALNESAKYNAYLVDALDSFTRSDSKMKAF